MRVPNIGIIAKREYLARLKSKGFWISTIALPILMARKGYFKKYYDKMGPPRYYIGMTLFLTMMLMPIKMYCRWLFNLKYFVHIQEFFLNI